MNAAITHRGPDADGFYEEENVALGHRRLSIIDLSEVANQPMNSHNDRYVIVFNGEIYNFAALKKNFDCNWKTQGDTEVILEMFQKFGNDCANHFNGMFAMAIYDRREKSLTCFRDRFGVKPLYYYWNGKDFAFASELKALLQLDIEKEIDKEAVQDEVFIRLACKRYTLALYFNNQL